MQKGLIMKIKKLVVALIGKIYSNLTEQVNSPASCQETRIRSPSLQ